MWFTLISKSPCWPQEVGAAGETEEFEDTREADTAEVTQDEALLGETVTVTVEASEDDNVSVAPCDEGNEVAAPDPSVAY